jgi:secreted trypsin-like serine protease
MKLSVVFASLFAVVFSAEAHADDANLAMLRRHAQARVVGGDTVTSDRYPYFAALQIRSFATSGGGASVSFCGGTLIAADVILVSSAFRTR